MTPAIRVDGLSKLYRVGARQQGYKTLRECLTQALWSPIQRLRQSFAIKAETEGAAGRLSGENFWALKDVNFEVKPGEVVGIIGRNGAGKSTLLKIFSRITEPTSGRIELRGRVGSLLEVGTGFHPELTGRENVYMNGSILGMNRREIRSKFDEIVAFAEIEEFLDTPVKRYSSGMYVRLAFAVAAHLEPEILIVDEVLAVGDAGFQTKCVNRMRQASSDGTTVLFVSHNMASLSTLCSRGILLTDGRLAASGPIDYIVAQYFASVDERSSVCASSRTDRSGNQTVRLLNAHFCSPHRSASGALVVGEPAIAEFTCNRFVRNITCAFTIYNMQGVPLTRLCSPPTAAAESETKILFRCALDPLLLAPGRYRVNVAISAGKELLDHLTDAATFIVEGGSINNVSISEDPYCHFYQPHMWRQL
jgi:lipopolysaccharide transport system ATP-binding protein